MKNPVRNLLNLILIPVVSLILWGNSLHAQGFIKTFPVNSNFWGSPSFVEILPDGYCLSGYEGILNGFGAFQLTTNPNGTQVDFVEDTLLQAGITIGCGQFLELDTVLWAPGNSSVILKKLDANGTVHWIDTLPQALPGKSNLPIGVKKTLEGKILVMGYDTADFQVFIQQLDEFGSLLSTQVIPSPTPEATSFIGFFYASSPDSGVLSTLTYGLNNTTTWIYKLLKIASNGTIEWTSDITPDFYNSLKYAQDGNFYGVELGGDANPAITDHCDLVKHAPNGDVLWRQRVREVLGVGKFNADLVVPTLDHGVLVCGGFWPIPTSAYGRSVIGRFDSNGQLLWKKEYFGIDRLFFTDGKALPNGNFVLCGSQNLDLMLMGMDSLGNIFPNALEGKILRDENADCTADTADTPLANWIVNVLVNGEAYYATTDSNGHYHISNLPGDTTYTLEVSAQPPSFLWQACASQTLTMPDTSGLTLVSDIAVETLEPCPYMVVDIGATEFVPCFKSVFYVNYANFGSGTATNTAVEVDLPEAISITGAPIPYTQTGQTLRFEVGTVAPAESGSFFFFGLVSCDSAYIGQALTVEAHIFPDTFCSIPPGWSGATIVLEADCLGDSVQLLMKNKGIAPTTQALEYLIIDDDVVMMQGTIPAGFPVNGEQKMHLPANGSTFRISAEQEPNHPLPGNPSVAVEGCNGTNYGFVSGFSNQTGDPFGDLFSQLVSGPGNNTQKWVFPAGLQAPHYVDPGAPLSYVLRFKNSGPDVVNRVVIRDTLSPWLLPASVIPGASSHPYTWSLEGNGIVVFTFDPISLPTENTNPDACSGYLQFSVQMRPDLALGTVLENRASIYLDQNPAVVTNTVFNTVDTAYLEVQLVSTSYLDAEKRNDLQIFPNPTNGNISIWLKNETSQKGSIVLSDMLGKTMLQQDFTGNHLELLRKELPAGIYFLQILQDGNVVANGKVILQ